MQSSRQRRRRHNEKQKGRRSQRDLRSLFEQIPQDCPRRICHRHQDEEMGQMEGLLQQQSQSQAFLQGYHLGRLPILYPRLLPMAPQLLSLILIKEYSIKAQ
jgi:hypothetical protein